MTKKRKITAVEYQRHIFDGMILRLKSDNNAYYARELNIKEGFLSAHNLTTDKDCKINRTHLNDLVETDHFQLSETEEYNFRWLPENQDLRVAIERQGYLL